jgi:septal ring factor EnvC (AmiA/AmiB activator)
MPLLIFLQEGGFLESFGWAGIAISVVVGFFVLLYALKVALPSQLFNTTNDLLTKRTTERDDALRERDSARKEIEQLEEEMKTLRREIIQRIDISREDQDTIKELRQRLKALGE